MAQDAGVSRPLTWVVASDETAARWARALEGAGRVALPLHWSEVQPLEADVAEAALRNARHDRVLLTSAYAAQVLKTGSGAGHRASCVGARTAEAARAAGFEVVEVGASGAQALAERMLQAVPQPQRVLFLATSEAREEAVERLRSGGIQVDRLDVYRVVVREAFATEVSRARAPHAVLVGSPRAVATLQDPRVPWGWRGAVCVAPGPTTEQALREAGITRICTARGPTLPELLEAVEAALAPEKGHA